MENHYYANYNGMSVPNGHSYKYIEEKLKNGLFQKFHLTELDGFAEHLIYLGEEKGKHKFRRCFNGDIVCYTISMIHLLNKA